MNIPQEINFRNSTHIVLNDTADLKITIDDEGNYTIYVCENNCHKIDVKYVDYEQFIGD